MKNEIESVVIVSNPKGAVATMRFKDGKDDKIISSPSKDVLYTLVEQHVIRKTQWTPRHQTR